MKRPIGERFKAIRLSRKLSQKDMAEVIDLSHRYYQAVEKGKKKPSFEVVATALERLDIKASAFFEEMTPIAETVEMASLIELSNAWSKGGPLTRPAALYFLTGTPKYLQEIDAELRPEARTLREHFAQVQAASPSRKRK